MNPQPHDEVVRLFVAVELPEEAQEALGELSQGLRGLGIRGLRTADPRGIHLTLKFLGDVPVVQVDPIIEALVPAVGLSPFTLEMRGVGCFPNLQRPRVLWVGVEGEVERLLALQSAVEEALRPLGFPAEGRPFSPHLTLARLREGVTPQERRRAGEALARISWREGITIPVNAVSLMRSTLLPEGAQHTRLHLESLQGDPSHRVKEA